MFLAYHSPAFHRTFCVEADAVAASTALAAGASYDARVLSRNPHEGQMICCTCCLANKGSLRVLCRATGCFHIVCTSCAPDMECPHCVTDIVCQLVVPVEDEPEVEPEVIKKKPACASPAQVIKSKVIKKKPACASPAQVIKSKVIKKKPACASPAQVIKSKVIKKKPACASPARPQSKNSKK
jgi:hypothetical protein